MDRRSLIAGAVGAGILVPAALGRAATPTPRNALGPFYRREAPNDAQLRQPGDAGLALALTGSVSSLSGEPVAGARIELWHADHGGVYDLSGNRFRATLLTGEGGSWNVDTVMPGHYPDRVCQHVHFLVRAPGHETLVTQLYFATDPVFEGDPAANFQRDPAIGDPALIRPVAIDGRAGEALARCRFDIVLVPA